MIYYSVIHKNQPYNILLYFLLVIRTPKGNVPSFTIHFHVDAPSMNPIIPIFCVTANPLTLPTFKLFSQVFVL